MARPKVEGPPAAALRALIGSDEALSVRVTPGASKEEIVLSEDRVAVRVRAKPQDGAANSAVCRLVAKALGIAPSKVELLRGATSRQKVLRVSDQA